MHPYRSYPIGNGYIFLRNKLNEERMADLIVKNAVKEAVDGKNVASDFYDALDERVEALLNEAATRADANDRKTVQARDL